MQPHNLEYLTPEPALYSWQSLLHLFLLGPFTGAVIGFVQTSAAVLIWVFHGQPDFYFRGWSGVDAHYLLLIIGGGFLGVGYGVLLWAFERFSHCRIRLVLTIPLVTAIAFAVAAVIAEHEFRQLKIGLFCLPQLIAVALGLLTSVLLSRKVLSKSATNVAP